MQRSGDLDKMSFTQVSFGRMAPRLVSTFLSPLAEKHPLRFKFSF